MSVITLFCPNCGKDCGEAKFCSECGAKLQQDTKKEILWSVGMPWPHCGATKLDGNNGSFCGAQLIADIPVESEENMVEYLGMGRFL